MMGGGGYRPQMFATPQSGQDPPSAGGEVPGTGRGSLAGGRFSFSSVPGGSGSGSGRRLRGSD